MSMFDTEKLIEAVEKTGYDFEHHVYEMLKINGWQVISNRYYIDDVKGIEREIDLLAYKVVKDSNDILFYTILIISCKKAKESLWVFLTRQKPERDPNTEYLLVENDTTDKRLALMLKNNQEEIKDALYTSPQMASLFETLHIPFAFQQINVNSFKLEDDKRIYDSIITTIKALEYEKGNSGRRRIDSAKGCFYNFNLLSIFDGKMCEVFFHEDGKVVSEIPEIKYINRHIVGTTESFYRVHFISKDSLPMQLDLYNELHLHNKKIYPQLINEFYNNIFNDSEKVDIHWEEFCKAIRGHFNYELIYTLGFKTDNRTNNFTYDYEDGILKIHFDGYHDADSSDLLERVNKHAGLKELVQKTLKRIYRYDGSFVLDNDYLPF